MSLLIGFLTFILVLTSVLLILLVLIQLPKKEAGAGLAFGGGAVDTLIGAGSGNALTKLTKYSAAIFMGLALVLAFLNAQRHDSTSSSLQDELSRKSSAAGSIVAPPATTAPAVGILNTQTQSTATEPASGTLQPSTNLPVLQLTPQSTSGAPAKAAPAEAQP